MKINESHISLKIDNAKTSLSKCTLLKKTPGCSKVDHFSTEIEGEILRNIHVVASINYVHATLLEEDAEGLTGPLINVTNLTLN